MSSAKHVSGTTLGKCPALYPYVMEHINEDDIARNLRSSVEVESQAMMAGSPDEAAFFNWLLPSLNAKIVIEVGTFRGTTALALARGLPADGKLYALDISEEYTNSGREAWRQAGVADRIDLRIAPAADTMRAMLSDPNICGKVDFVFIDAEKTGYDTYYELALQLLRPGGVVAVDNVLWSGTMLQPEAQWDESTKAIVALNKKIRADSRVHATMLPIADGAYMVRKL
eukprot:PhM_4_TR6232/c0_g1_i1/m.61405